MHEIFRLKEDQAAQEVICQGKLRELVQKAYPKLLKELEGFPEGIQIEVFGPKQQINFPAEARILEEFHPHVIRYYDNRGKLRISPQIGVLNMKMIGGREVIDLEYRVQEYSGVECPAYNMLFDGVDFLASEREVAGLYKKLSHLFGGSGELNTRDDRVHVGAKRSLALFDRDGKPLHK